MKCSHCGSENLTKMNDGKNVERYHCNTCFVSTSDTAGTEWHRTRLPKETREKLKEAHGGGMTIRKAAEHAGVDKNTAHRAFKLFG